MRIDMMVIVFTYKQYDIFTVLVYDYIVLDHVYQCNNYVNINIM